MAWERNRIKDFHLTHNKPLSNALQEHYSACGVGKNRGQKDPTTSILGQFQMK